jgi:ribonuclease HI
MNQVIIYTDGSCRTNPGPGGWSAVLLSNDRTQRKELSGSVLHATNNEMELRGAIEGLKALKRPCLVQIRSDSRYLVDGGNGLTRQKANKALWGELREARSKHRVLFVWLKGHNGHEENERCDELAKEAALDAELEAEYPI